MTMHPVAATLNAIKAELQSRFFEREDAIEAIFLAIASREHTFLLGPPGTGKSLLITTVVEAITGARYFECAMSKTRSAEAVLGPLDILEFRNNGHMWRKRKGFATDCEYVFIDEIGKMSSILGHDLLALLNERKYHEVNGQRSVHKAPLLSAFTASNEMPTDESDDTAALWDRLLFRVTVDYLKDNKNFTALLNGTMAPLQTTVDFADLQQAIETVVPAVTLSKDAMKGIVALRKALAKEHIYPSDRRWKASMKALQASAFLDGRDVVYEEDLAALRFTLWETLPQIEKVERLCTASSNPFVDRLLNARSQIKEISDGIATRKDKAVTERAAYAKEANGKLATIRGELDQLLTDAKGRVIPKFKEVADLHRDTLRTMYTDCFDMEPEVAEAAITKKLGLGDGTKVSA